MADITVSINDIQKCAIGASAFRDSKGDAFTLPLPSGYSVNYTSDNTAVVAVDAPDADWNTFVRAVGPLGSATVTGELMNGSAVVATHTWGVTVVVGPPVDFTPVAGEPIAQ